MDLDLAIQNTLKRSPMEGAMHGVLSDFGGTYQLNAYTESASAAESNPRNPRGGHGSQRRCPTR